MPYKAERLAHFKTLAGMRAPRFAVVVAWMVTIGIGIAAAAAQFGLYFIPLTREQYYFVCLKETLDAPAVIRLRELLRLCQWQDTIASLPGYDTAATGEVVPLRQAMPWYSFRKPKP